MLKEAAARARGRSGALFRRVVYPAEGGRKSLAGSHKAFNLYRLQAWVIESRVHHRVSGSYGFRGPGL